jgi:hypothetical protein
LYKNGTRCVSGRTGRARARGSLENSGLNHLASLQVDALGDNAHLKKQSQFADECAE